MMGSKIIDSPGDIGDMDRLHVHIAYTGKKYQYHQNYPALMFRIDHKKKTIFRLVLLYRDFYRLNKVCIFIRILGKYREKRRRVSLITQITRSGSLMHTFAALHQISFCSQERRSNTSYP
jgi:hypothetical protein